MRQLFVVSASTNSTDGIDLSAAYIVDNNLAPIMSVSFGKCEFFLGTSGNMMFNQLWQQAAMQDITVFVAAGDQGSAMCDTAPFPDVPRERDVCVAGLPCPNATEAAFSVKGLAVNGLASTPYNVAVGGTDFNDFNIWQDFWNVNNNSTTQASAKGYVPETTWNDSCTNGLLSSLGYSADPEANCNNSASQLDFLVVFGGGGGASSCTMSDFNPNTLQGDLSSCSAPYAKPSWQAGNGMPNDGRRDIPDVSLFASNGFTGSFYIVCQADADPDMSGAQCDLNSPFMHFIGIGGTSAASPAFAGIMALVNQKTGSRQGNANYVFYKLAAQSGASCASSGTPGTSCIFYDVTSGTNAMPCLKPSLGCNVSNSADQFGILSGYSATAGYDLATGLGSVNAANLVNNWSTGAVASFSVSPNPANVNIATAGQSGTSTITATGTNGFTGSVSFTCSVSPVPVNDPPTCFVFPFSVSLSATTTSATAALKISTTAGLSSGLQPGNHPKTPIYFAASAGIVMTCVFLLALLGIGVLVFIGLALTSCASERGGSSQINLGTPSGGYIVTVTATSGGAAQSTTVSLNVQ
jgi:subtilase family serine protease